MNVWKPNLHEPHTALYRGGWALNNFTVYFTLHYISWDQTVRFAYVTSLRVGGK
jgi:hypothetical protein